MQLVGIGVIVLNKEILFLFILRMHKSRFFYRPGGAVQQADKAGYIVNQIKFRASN